MSTLTIIANITAKSDKIDLVKTELLKLIDITRAETGCLKYDLHQDNENPAHFTFYETWTSQATLQAHLNNKHLIDYIVATEDAVEAFVLNEMTQIA